MDKHILKVPDDMTYTMCEMQIRTNYYKIVIDKVNQLGLKGLLVTDWCFTYDPMERETVIILHTKRVQPIKTNKTS